MATTRNRPLIDHRRKPATQLFKHPRQASAIKMACQSARSPADGFRHRVATLRNTLLMGGPVPSNHPCCSVPSFIQETAELPDTLEGRYGRGTRLRACSGLGITQSLEYGGQVSILVIEIPALNHPTSAESLPASYCFWRPTSS